MTINFGNQYNEAHDISLTTSIKDAITAANKNEKLLP
ncbi:hypothetical protein CAL7102_00306 [Dulcicalothrix desertica PCC 7102]|nr:hypothetical protein CAL7102_00306 [Dulcicalothrix desertica PCC 7102]